MGNGLVMCPSPHWTDIPGSDWVPKAACLCALGVWPSLCLTQGTSHQNVYGKKMGGRQSFKTVLVRGWGWGLVTNVTSIGKKSKLTRAVT